MSAPFAGFDKPRENWSKLPHAFIDVLDEITSLAELKVVLYVLRHTWGYQDFANARLMSIDEIANGRKSADDGRLDNGTGMSDNAVKDGIARAVEHGFLVVETDDKDKARIKKKYRLNMVSEGQQLTLEGQELTPRGSEVDPRTKKDTLERKDEKEVAPRAKRHSAPATTSIPSPELIAVKEHPLYCAYFTHSFPPSPVMKSNVAVYQETIIALESVGITPAQIEAYVKAQPNAIPFQWLADRVQLIARGANNSGVSTERAEWDKFFARTTILNEVQS